MSAIVRAAAGFASLRLPAVAEEPGPPHPAAIQLLKITEQDLPLWGTCEKSIFTL